MERVLSQDEIDAMIRRARGQQIATSPEDKRTIKPCAFRQSGQLQGEQVRAVTSLHEAFTRNFSQSLGAILGGPFELKLVSVEQLTYSEFLERVPAVTYFASLQVSPMNAMAAIQIDHSILFPLLDILLGGLGHCPPMTREVTEIEEQIIESVVRLTSKELSGVWGPLGASVELQGREACSRMQRFLPMSEKTLCLTFEATLEATRGTLNLIFPTAISNPLLRRLAMEGLTASTGRRTEQKLRDRMLDCRFPISLRLHSCEYPIDSLLSAASGSVVDLNVPVSQTASLMVGDREICDAMPVQNRGQKAAQVVSRPTPGVEATRL